MVANLPQKPSEGSRSRKRNTIAISRVTGIGKRAPSLMWVVTTAIIRVVSLAACPGSKYQFLSSSLDDTVRLWDYRFKDSMVRQPTRIIGWLTEYKGVVAQDRKVCRFIWRDWRVLCRCKRHECDQVIRHTKFWQGNKLGLLGAT